MRSSTLVLGLLSLVGSAHAACSSTLRGGAQTESQESQEDRRRLLPDNCRDVWMMGDPILSQCFERMNNQCGPAERSWGISAPQTIFTDNPFTRFYQLVAADGCYDPDAFIPERVNYLRHQFVGRVTLTTNPLEETVSLAWDIALSADNQGAYFQEVNWYAGPDSLYQSTPGVFTKEPSEFPFHQYNITTQLPQEETQSVEFDRVGQKEIFGDAPLLHITLHAVVCDITSTLFD